MAKSERQKLKLLYLRDYLRQNTDETHPASINDLIAYLAGKDVRAERKSIYDDLLTLQDYGMQIHYKRTRPSGYYVATRDFELPEIKYLIDAVLSSRFLTPEQSGSLVRKLAALSTGHEAALLRRQIVLAGRVKSDSGENLKNIDLLHEAIGKNRRITFRYFDWGIDRQKHFRQGIYEASPYALLWDDENYYLIAHSERHGLTHYRVDKMMHVAVSEKARIVTDEMRSFSPSVYSREVFGMFRGTPGSVRLRFENGLSGVVIDRFGRDVCLIPDGKTHFILTVRVAISANFMGWLAGFGGRATILAPKKAVEEYREFCLSVLSAIAED